MFLERRRGRVHERVRPAVTLYASPTSSAFPKPIETIPSTNLGRPHRGGGGAWEARGTSIAPSPLEFLYGRFAGYIEDRRREPRNDLLTEIAPPRRFRTVPRPRSSTSCGLRRTCSRPGRRPRFGSSPRHSNDSVRMTSCSDLCATNSAHPGLHRGVPRAESPVKGDFRLAGSARCSTASRSPPVRP